jgi:hypothetical protein
MDHRAGMDAEVRGKIVCLCRGSNPGLSIRSQAIIILGKWYKLWNTLLQNFLWPAFNFSSLKRNTVSGRISTSNKILDFLS